ncbi:MAG: hypothetical protein WBD22_04130 [Pyrinomonadaceae bacterium]
MRQTKKGLCFSVIIILSTCFAQAYMLSGQTAEGTTDINIIVDRAALQSKNYLDTFKNLLSEETKSFEIYDKKGKLKRVRQIQSTFIVYQSPKDSARVTEFRNVHSVDGKKLERNDQRAADFFERVSSAETSAIELDRIEAESTRYDGDIFISGLTVFQAVALRTHLRPYFDFVLEGRTKIGDVEALIVSFTQNRPSPYILVGDMKKNPDGKLTVRYDLDTGSAGDPHGRLRGKLWLDPVTMQTIRELREMTIRRDQTSGPDVLASNTFEYQPSSFGILTPKIITHTQYGQREPSAKAIPELQVTFTYSNFSSPDVEVRSSEVH